MKKDIQLPIRGVSDLLGADRQEEGTTRRAKNVREVDPVDLTVGGIAQRAGQVKHTSAAIGGGAGKIAHLASIVYDNPSHTYANLASAQCTVEWASPGENRSEALNVVHDDFGNHYYLDGAAAIVKVNSSGRKVWNLPLPAIEKGSKCRALAVDVNGRIFAATSEGVQPEDARIWAFEQVDEKQKPELLWTLEPGWFTEELHIDGATLQASQNDPIGRFSRMALYSGLGIATPELIREWDIPYPVNGHHFSPKDGSIFTAHPPDEMRTHTPRSPETSGSREDWTPRDLDSFADRVWAWVDANDVDGGGLGNADYAAGDVIETLVDKTGNGRGFVVNTPDTGPILRKGGIAGLDSLYFNGSSNSMTSEAGVSTDFQFRGLNRSFLPTYSKSQFALFMVLRIPQESTMRAVLGNASTNEKAIIMNGGIETVGPEMLPSSITYFEEAAGAGASGPTWGGSVSQLGGCFDDSGLVLVTVVFDHGYDDVASVPTRSTVRVNGRPCDRWTSSTTSAANTNPVGLGRCLSGLAALTGLARLKGDFCEAIVLSDWYTAGFGQTSPLTQQRLVTMPIYPDAVWSADGDTELERIEGYLAHKWGMAHKLSTGQQNALRETANPANGDTVTIGATTYTFKTAITAAANDVDIGATGRLSLVNLMHAINGSGIAGTDYSAATTRNTEVFAAGVCHSSDPTGFGTLIVQRRDPRIYATFATTETSANLSWVNGATSVSAADGGGVNDGAYPHSFYLFTTYGITGAGTPISWGGPPRDLGVTFPSVIGALISPYGMLAKWDPANGRARNVLTTNGPGFVFLPVGGVGYGVRIGSDGSVFSIGPRQAAVSGIIASADNVDVRKVWDRGAEDTAAGGWGSGAGFSLGTTATKDWEAAPGAQTYAYPRMGLDEWDNIYVPLYQASNGSSLAVYAKLGASAGSLNADALLVLQSLTDDPRAYAVSIDPESPKYPHNYAQPRAERVLLGTERVTSAANFNTLHMVRIVSASQSVQPVRAHARLAVVGGGLYDFTDPTSVSTVSASAFNSASPFISGCEAFGRLFYTDGSNYREYDPRKTQFSFLRSRGAGELPKRGRLMERFVNRLFIGGFEDFPERVCASTAGDPYGWDFDPPGEAPATTAAYRSDLTTSGDFPDVVQGLRAWRDDLLYIFGARNVFMLRGDPLQGGRFDTVVKGTGAAFGRASCFTPDGRIWWITNEAELYWMPVGGGEGSARNAGAPIAKRLQDAIDFSVCRPELVYDPRVRALRIFLFPLGAGDTLFTHFTVSLVDPARPRFWPDTYGATGIQPTAAMLLSGDLGEDRVLLYGSRDGYVREWNAAAKDDDGTRIDSECLIAPLVDQSLGMEAMVSNIEITLARAQGGARAELFASDESDDLGDAVGSASLLPGRNTPADLRASGAFLGLMLAGETGMERFSVRRVLADVQASSDIVRGRGR